MTIEETKTVEVTVEEKDFDPRLKALTVERDAAVTRAETAERELAATRDQLAEIEVEALVGVKIAAHEKSDFLALRKSNPTLFKSMTANREDLGLMLGQSITAKGNNATAPRPLGGPETDAFAVAAAKAK